MYNNIVLCAALFLCKIQLIV